MTSRLIAKHFQLQSPQRTSPEDLLASVNTPTTPASPEDVLENARRVLAAADDRAMLTQMQQSVLERRERLRPQNTAKAMDPKALEFFQHCEQEFPNEPHKCNLTFQKTFKFMWHHAMREQKPKGKTKAVQSAHANGVWFDREDYKKVIEAFKED